jgi:hypothetical protein
MKKSLITIVSTMFAFTAALYAVGKNEQKKDEIKSLEHKLRHTKGVNRVYRENLEQALRQLPGYESRELVKKINDDLDFSHIVNHM